MEEMELESFVEQFSDFPKWATSKQIEYLGYFLTAVLGGNSFTAKQLDDCFRQLSLKPYSRMSSYLSEYTGKKGTRFIKNKTGYRLERSIFDGVKRVVNSEPKKIQVSQQLSDLVLKIKDSQERIFLEEAINCYKVEAFRATIILVWMLTMEHLQRYVFKNHLLKFNAAIAAHPDKKIRQVANYDDLSEFKESRVIELMRSANIISKDVQKILNEKLGIRNSAGHPSGIVLGGHKTTEFALDLLQNILLKY